MPWVQLGVAAAPYVLDWLFGGDDEPQQHQTSPLESEMLTFLEDWEAPTWEGPLQADRPEMWGQLSDLFGGRIAGEGLGIDPQTRELMLKRAQQPLAAERRHATRRAGGEMAQRGLGDSTIADQLLAAIEGEYGRGMAEAQTAITLQDIQQQMQQQQQAEQMAMQMAGQEHAWDQAAIDRMLQQWWQEQQMALQPWQMGMQYLTGVQMPQQQFGLQQEQLDAQQWAALGQMVGQVLGAEPIAEGIADWLF